jgi:hypothetical protein
VTIPLRQPFIFEINAAVWLRQLSRDHGQTTDLFAVSKSDWDAILPAGTDAVWLMGVWERSPAGTAIALENPQLLASFRDALPDFRPEDVIGSPYCVRRYRVAEELGGESGLTAARAELERRGIGLVLDYVPNHVATDHPWTGEHPEYFIRGSREDLNGSPDAFIDVDGQVIARGRDPYFPPWPDVAQLNAFDPNLRAAAAATLHRIADMADGVRCDMAMLMLNDVFERTWGTRAGPRPESDFWTEVIPAVKDRRPEMCFIAEAYWDLEWALQQQGFDYCYDKRLYDRLVHDDAEAIRGHLTADMEYQLRLLRFLENHDEPRAARVMGPERERAAAVALVTLPGARLWHEGQSVGRRTFLPVFLGRRPHEEPDPDLSRFHDRLLDTVGSSPMRTGRWQLLLPRGWPDNDSCRHILSWSWEAPAGRFVVAVNMSDGAAQAEIGLPWSDMDARTWRLTDRLTPGRVFEWNGTDLARSGLYVGLDPWDYHVFSFEAL